MIKSPSGVSGAQQSEIKMHAKPGENLIWDSVKDGSCPNVESFVTPKRVIPFDYDNFCSDIPETAIPYFKGCSAQLHSTPSPTLPTNRNANGPAIGQYLKVPEINYGGVRRRRRSKGKSSSISGSESDTSDKETHVQRVDKNYNEVEEESDLEIKEPKTLRRKKIYPTVLSPEPSKCSVA